jgi:hypothetical protein
VEAHLRSSERKSLRLDAFSASPQTERMRVLRIRFVNGDLPGLYPVHRLDNMSEVSKERKEESHQLRCVAEPLHDDVGADTLLDVAANLLQKLCRKKHNTSRAISNLGVLGAGDVDQTFSRRMDDVKELQDGRAVVRDLRLSSLIDNEFVHAARAQSARERF